MPFEQRRVLEPISLPLFHCGQGFSTIAYRSDNCNCFFRFVEESAIRGNLLSRRPSAECVGQITTQFRH